MKRYNERFDAYYDDETRTWLESKCDDLECEYCTERPDHPPPFERGDRVYVHPLKTEATVDEQYLSYDGSECFWGNVRLKYDDGVYGTSNSWQCERISRNESQ